MGTAGVIAMALGFVWIVVSFVVLFLPLLAVIGWSRWLRRRTSAPLSASRLAYWFAGGGLAGVVLACVVGFLHAMGITPAADPSQKARILAESISEAMNCSAFAWLLSAVLVFVYLVYATWRWHWSAKKDEPPRDPPYR